MLEKLLRVLTLRILKLWKLSRCLISSAPLQINRLKFIEIKKERNDYISKLIGSYNFLIVNLNKS
jgi:hypothetical protein